MNNTRKKIMLIALLSGLGGSVIGCSCNQDINIISEKNIDLDDNDEEEDFNYELNELEENRKKETIYVSDNFELQKYLDEEVNFNKVKQELYQNQNIDDNYKSKILEVVNKLEEKIPQINLICLYENIKELNIEKISKNKMKKTAGKNAVAYFDVNNKKIVVTNDTSQQCFSHEVLHMLNNLKIETDEYLIIRKSYDDKQDCDFLSEAGTEWLNKFLFNWESCSYPIKVADFDILKFILNCDDKTMILNWNNYNSNEIYNTLINYLDLEDTKQLFEICQKELRWEQTNNKKFQMSVSEIQKKYDYLIQSIVASRSGKLNCKEVYEIYRLLYHSYFYYFNEICDYDIKLDCNIVSMLDNRILQTLLNYGIDTCNEIKIKNGDEVMNYYNLNNLYFGYKQNDDETYEIAIIEKYQDDSENDCFINLYDIDQTDFSNYKMVSILNLIDQLNIKDQVYISQLEQQFLDTYLNNKVYIK